MPSSTQPSLDALLYNTATSTLSYVNIGKLRRLLNFYPGHQLFTQPIPLFTKKIQICAADGSMPSGDGAGDRRIDLVWLPRKVVRGRLRGKFKKIWVVTGMDDMVD